MAQARRKKQAKINPKRGAGKSNIGPIFAAFRRGFGLLSTGALAGVLGTLMWQGYHSDNQGDMGSGLKKMREQSLHAAEQAPIPEPILIDKTPRPKSQYDFYTVLPAIEEVMPKDAGELLVAQKAASSKVASSKVDRQPQKSKPAEKAKSASGNKVEVKTVKVKPKPLKAGSSYVLQVASYGNKAVADRLKAKLALGGMRANIQKVSIDGKDYFRVRIGPYSDYGSMTSDDYKLSKMGHKAMRLRLSKAG